MPARAVQKKEAFLPADGESPEPVYLFIGEPFQTEAAARSLIDALVPAQRRSFNLEVYDGRTSPMGPILDSMRMAGLFVGTKVLWVREPTLFVAGEKRSELTTAMFHAWSEDRAAEAAQRLLAIAALAGWSHEQFSSTKWDELSTRQANSLFGRALDGRERQTLETLAALCSESGDVIAEHRDEAAHLEEFLTGGAAGSNVLIFSASTVDRRKRIVKTLAKLGRVVEFTLARERSGALGPDGVAALVGQTLSRHGKQIAPRGRRLVEQRAGRDAALLVSELEKLCLYVGDVPLISEADVRASMRDLAESWIFDFTRAFAQGRAAEAIPLLRSLFAQGDHPLRLMALIARELRLLLVARDCLADSLLAGAWTPNTSYNVFRDRLLPTLGEAQSEAFGGLHPYALYQCVQNASRTSTIALQRALLALQRLDIRMKSGAGDPQLLLESYVLDVCRPARLAR